jgi:hypothetical protein
VTARPSTSTVGVTRTTVFAWAILALPAIRPVRALATSNVRIVIVLI